jgi:hypothetical protein
MYCDEVAAATVLDAAQASTVAVSTQGTNSFVPNLEVLRVGCRQLRCDEPNGPVCNDGWLCEPELADPNGLGCNPIPCAELGHCSEDQFICEPTSTNSRGPSVDPHGCVQKNCEEGSPCAAMYICDFSRPDADVMGCSPLKCDEPMGRCPVTTQICEPTSPSADLYGCRPQLCTDGVPCSTNATCDPTNPQADYLGCVNPVVISQGGSGPVPDPDPVAPPPKSPLGGSCAMDEDCQQGYCVAQICSATPGQCRTP